VRLMLPARYT